MPVSSTTRQKQSPSQRERGSQSYHHGNLRRALLDVSLDLIEREGVASLSLREVSRRAGVTHAAPYRHFADKEALLAGVAEEGHQTLLAEMLQGLEKVNAGSSAARIEAVAITYVGFAVDHPSYFRVMFGPELSDGDRYPSLLAASERSFDLLISEIETAQTLGALRAGAALPLALTVWCQMHGLAHLLVDDRLARKRITAEQAPSLARDQVRELITALGPGSRTTS